jgi:hypothetical protein
MNLNKDFYKRIGFVFIGIIVVLIVARYTIFTSGSVTEKNIEYKNIRPGEVIDWRNAAKFIGDYVTVEGKIVGSYKSSKVCFLNFHPDYKKYLTLVIFSSDFNEFPLHPNKFYLDKKVQAKGRIKEYKGKPEIILESPSQIKILD